MEGKEAVNEAKKFLERLKPDLSINRVPNNTLIWFKQFASMDEFAGDYGFALRELVNCYKERTGEKNGNEESK